MKWGCGVNIQQSVEMIALEFLPYGGFHINWVRFEASRRWSLYLSYKQVRDALYRLRWRFPVEHWGMGLYKWFHSSHSRIVRPLLIKARVYGAINYRRLGLQVRR